MKPNWNLVMSKIEIRAWIWEFKSHISIFNIDVKEKTLRKAILHSEHYVLIHSDLYKETYHSWDQCQCHTNVSQFQQLSILDTDLFVEEGLKSYRRTHKANCILVLEKFSLWSRPFPGLSSAFRSATSTCIVRAENIFQSFWNLISGRFILYKWLTDKM